MIIRLQHRYRQHPYRCCASRHRWRALEASRPFSHPSPFGCAVARNPFGLCGPLKQFEMRKDVTLPLRVIVRVFKLGAFIIHRSRPKVLRIRVYHPGNDRIGATAYYEMGNKAESISIVEGIRRFACLVYRTSIDLLVSERQRPGGRCRWALADGMSARLCRHYTGT